MKVYVVTVIVTNKNDPILTAFYNYDDAKKFFDYEKNFSSRFKVYLDELPLQNGFSVLS